MIQAETMSMIDMITSSSSSSGSSDDSNTISSILDLSQNNIITKVSENIFSFPLLTNQACSDILAEAENFIAVSEKKGWEIRRPNRYVM